MPYYAYALAGGPKMRFSCGEVEEKTMTDLTLSAEQMRQFAEDGYLILENLLAPEDVERILHIARCDPQLAADAGIYRDFGGAGFCGTASQKDRRQRNGFTVDSAGGRKHAFQLYGPGLGMAVLQNVRRGERQRFPPSGRHPEVRVLSTQRSIHSSRMVNGSPRSMSLWWMVRRKVPSASMT